jgi:uncharacterized protein (TIGR03790 family)
MNRLTKIFPCLFFLFLLQLTSIDLCRALEPQQVLVVANINVPKGVTLGRYYMEKRGIPENNIVKLFLPEKEHCDRKTYEARIATVLRKKLAEKAYENVKCLVFMYGVPLVIMESEEAAGSPSGPKRNAASIDSEATLLKIEDHRIDAWIANPLFLVNIKNKTAVPHPKEDILFVSRLDGPDPETVQRIIDDSLYAEEKGLYGKAYFDARSPKPEKVEGAYSFYDSSIHIAADRIRKEALLPVVLNESDALFQPGEAPDAALYCGWYSLAKYIDAFTWKKGSVGFHIASSECSTLKNPSSKVWCLQMLKKGVAATLGPVGEPYVNAFPIPHMFFGILTSGRYPLVEAYFASLPHLSWQMLLVGDPLYKPFKARTASPKQ